jgi:hypothetical protein
VVRLEVAAIKWGDVNLNLWQFLFGLSTYLIAQAAFIIYAAYRVGRWIEAIRGEVKLVRQEITTTNKVLDVTRDLLMAKIQSKQ